MSSLYDKTGLNIDQAAEEISRLRRLLEKAVADGKAHMRRAEALEAGCDDLLDRLVEATDYIEDQGDEKEADELHFIGELRAAIAKARLGRVR